jgi:phage/plasmid-associated DNA primase
MHTVPCPSCNSSVGPSALVNKAVALVGEVELSANPQRAKIVEVLKSIIGEDSISINTKYESKFPSLRLPTRFVIASNSVPRLLDASGALAHRFLFVPFEKGSTRTAKTYPLLTTLLPHITIRSVKPASFPKT